MSDNIRYYSYWGGDKQLDLVNEIITHIDVNVIEVPSSYKKLNEEELLLLTRKEGDV